MIVPEPDGTLTVACDVCGIGCPAPWYGHYDPSEAYAGARRHQWQADPYEDDLCLPCNIAIAYAASYASRSVRSGGTHVGDDMVDFIDFKVVRRHEVNPLIRAE